MRRTALGIGAAAGISSYGISGGPGSPVESAAAATWQDYAKTAATAVVGGPIALGWALRNFEIIGSDSPPSGLTLDVLKQDVSDTIRARQSNNRSTFIDNKNILDGLKHVAYTDGKIAAIEALNAEKSQEDVQAAALDAAKGDFATVKKNLLKSWNETMNELNSLVTLLHDHPDLGITSPLDSLGGINDGNPLNDHITPMAPNDSSLWLSGGTYSVESFNAWYVNATESVTLPTGEVFDVNQLSYDIWIQSDGGNDNSRSVTLSPVTQSQYPLVSPKGIRPNDTDGGPYPDVARADLWSEIWTKAESVESEVLGGLQNWTANVYTEVQSGSIDVADLLTPREQAELLSDDEEFPQAVADLLALNIPVDPDREATISFTNQDITIKGLLAPTQPPADGFVVGQTYDPSAEPWDLYFTYDPNATTGGWTDYETTISEGALVFTAEPPEGSVFQIPTTDGTVEVTTSDFAESTAGGTWTADLSAMVGRTSETWTDYTSTIDGGTVTFGSLSAEPTEFDIVAIDGGTDTVSKSEFTEVDSTTFTVETSLGISEIDSVTARIDRVSVQEGEEITVLPEGIDLDYQTVQVTDPFTLDQLEDAGGNTYGQAEFSQSEPQDDTNYITQDEWDALTKQNQELIKKYEDATKTEETTSGGGSGYFSGDTNYGLLAAGAGALALGWGYMTGEDN